MLCCTVDEQSIGHPLSTSSMYRNLHSDPDQSSSSSGFFQSGYQHKIPPAPSYQTGDIGMPQTPNTSEASYSRSGLGHEYSSQFFVSGVNPHCHSEPGSSQPSWASPTIYSGNPLPPVLSNAWEPINQQYPGHHSAGPLSTPSSYPLSSHVGRPSLVSRPVSPVSSQGPLSGIECFTGGPDVNVPGSLQLPSMHPVPMSTQRRPYEWINKNAYQNPQAPQGKTRTKDKYRVVYSDHQRLELEKEFRFSRYITIRRKSELAAQLMLSERQVKIWFQNRRAKERKATKKGMDSNNRAVEEDDAEGEASDNSGHGIESPAGASSLQNLTPLDEVSGYDQIGHLPHSSSSIDEPQDGDRSQHSSTMSYLYNMTSPNSYIPDIDIKPMLSGSDDAHGVTSTLDDISLPQVTSSSIIHQSPGEM